MKYWYKDHWSGSIHEFSTLREAKASAKEECGASISIYRKDGSTACVVDASGYTYP